MAGTSTTSLRPPSPASAPLPVGPVSARLFKVTDGLLDLAEVTVRVSVVGGRPGRPSTSTDRRTDTRRPRPGWTAATAGAELGLSELSRSRPGRRRHAVTIAQILGTVSDTRPVAVQCASGHGRVAGRWLGTGPSRTSFGDATCTWCFRRRGPSNGPRDRFRPGENAVDRDRPAHADRRGGGRPRPLRHLHGRRWRVAGAAGRRPAGADRAERGGEDDAAAVAVRAAAVDRRERSASWARCYGRTGRTC